MWQDVKEIYARAFAFSRVLPMLFMIPVLAEAAQHLVEVRIGMYDSWDGARASADTTSRMAWGFVKTLALASQGYWFVRYMAWRDPRKARAIEAPAAALFLVILAVQAAVQALALFGSGVASFGLEGPAGKTATAVLAVFQVVVSVYLSAWLIAWPLGEVEIGPLRSVGIMAGNFWRSVGYLFAGVVPLMALHYALGIGAIGRPRGVVTAMLALDSVVVGYLALTKSGAIYVAARHAARRRGVSLTGELSPAGQPV